MNFELKILRMERKDLYLPIRNRVPQIQLISTGFFIKYCVSFFRFRFRHFFRFFEENLFYLIDID